MSENWITDYCLAIQTILLSYFNIFLNGMFYGWTKVCEHDYNQLAIESFMWYNEKVQYIKDKSSHLYTTYPLIKTATDRIVYGFLFTKSKVMNYKIEPLRSNWISTSVLLKSDWIRPIGMNTNFIEIYEFIDTEISSANKEYIDNMFVDCFNKSCKSANSIAKCSDKVLEVMVTMKRGEQYIHSVFNKNEVEVEPLEFPLKPSKSTFLSVEYTHPDMSKGVVMELDKNVFFLNNEILSPLFVRRWLEYQPLAFKYDMTYVIKIMDSNIKTMDLTSGQHIFLDKTGNYMLM